MNWLTNFVRPKLQALTRKPGPPDNLWEKCSKCEQMIFHRELEANLRVCPHCGHHFRVGWKRRLELLFDDGQYERAELSKSVVDPLKFRDLKRYTDRLRDSQGKTGEGDAIVVASGRLGGQPLVIAAFNFEFMGGSMGTAVGDGLIRAAELAVEQKAALLVVPASGGARMQEGILSLMQMPRSIPTAAVVRGNCMSARMPSCMRAPPEAANMMKGVPLSTAVSRPLMTASPAAIPKEPPMKSKS